MGLIKSASAPTTISHFSMADIEKHAKQIILRAKQQADQLLAATMKEGEGLKENMVDEGRAQGHREGFATGLEQGRKAGREQALSEQRQQLTQVIEAMSNALKAIEADRRKLEAEALGDVIDLSIAIARRVTKRQAELDPKILGQNVSESMKLVVHSNDLRIAMNPGQKAVLQETIKALQMEWPTLQHAELVDDPQITPGGCRIFTRQGEIDATIDEQLDRVVSDLMPSRGDD